jgi:hypothetical protein
VTDPGWRVARLDEIERAGTGEWIPIRRHFGISSFGINAWEGDRGSAVIREHDESTLGHEELYLVISGAATFKVGQETVEARPGTIVFVRDPALKRAASATEDGTTILTVGGKPGAAFTMSPWELNADVFPLFDRGEFERARVMLGDAVEQFPGAAGLLYNLACAEARVGRVDEALAHLRQAIEVRPEFAEQARRDDDLESIRDDPRFPA